MSSTYRIIDPLLALGVDPPLSVNADGARIFECVRILCGTINLEEKSSRKIYKLRHCYLTESVRVLKRNTLREVLNVAFDGNVTIADMSGYLINVRRKNDKFWNDVLGELCHAVVNTSKADYTSSFLSVYRLLEMTSVALPLFYASAEHDYRNALTFLKTLPQNPRDGDLAILKTFSRVVAREGGYGAHIIQVPYSKGDFRWDAQYEAQISGCIINPHVPTATLDIPGKKIDIPFEDFPKFFVAFRNKLFHNTLSEHNINIDKLGGSDMACEPIIRPALNWIILLLCVIVKQNISRYI